MGVVQVTKEGTVNLRGIQFPVDNIRAAMLETGGIPVSDPKLNAVLDRVMIANREHGRDTNALVVDAIPDTWFIPIGMNLHTVPGLAGIPSGGWLYFAVKKKKIFNA
jgi:hypothetical protein